MPRMLCMCMHIHLLTLSNSTATPTARCTSHAPIPLLTHANPLAAPRRRPGRCEAAARPPPSAAEAAAAVANWAIAAPAGRCTAAPAAADGPGASASTGGVRPECWPPPSAHTAVAQPRRLHRLRAPSRGARERPRGEPCESQGQLGAGSGWPRCVHQPPWG